MPLRHASQPLYHRVYRQIAAEIEGGGLSPGERLPSERWLCDELGVSRATVRRALEELVADGLVETRGRASFVAGEALAEPPNALMSLSELGRSRGLTATARVLTREIRPATIDEAEGFGIAPGAELLDLQRLRMLDGMPISLDHNRVPLRLVPDATDIDFTTASLYDALEHHGNAPAHADYEIEARAAEPGEAALLGVEPGAAVLLATTIAVREDGRMVDMGRTVYRADRYRFQATLMRRPHREREGTHENSVAQRDRAGRGGARRRGLRRNARAEEAGGVDG
jgi:GntR family transcriptional regulator